MEMVHLEMVAAHHTFLCVQYYVQRQNCPCSLAPGLLYSYSSLSPSCCNGVMFLDRLLSLVALNTVERLILSCRLSSSAGREENKPRKVLVWKQWMEEAQEGWIYKRSEDWGGVLWQTRTGRNLGGRVDGEVEENHGYYRLTFSLSMVLS